MIKLTVETEGLMNQLKAIREKGIVYAVSMAMTWTAKAAADAFKKDLTKLDRPTPFTQNASRYKPATKDRTEYDVFIQDEASKGVPPSKYLKALVQGGYRANKKTERALRSKGILPPGWQIEPGEDAKLDAYGNLQGGGGRYVQILSALKAMGEQGYTANRTAASAKRNARTQRDYFVLYSLKTKTPLGIYTRKGKRDVAQILKFVPKRAKYSQTLHFAETIAKSFNENFDKYFKEGLQRMLIKVRSW